MRFQGKFRAHYGPVSTGNKVRATKYGVGANAKRIEKRKEAKVLDRNKQRAFCRRKLPVEDQEEPPSALRFRLRRQRVDRAAAAVRPPAYVFLLTKISTTPRRQASFENVCGTSAKPFFMLYIKNRFNPGLAILFDYGLH